MHTGHRAHSFEGRRSRRYDLMARWLMRPAYHRIATDLASAVPDGAALLDVGTGPGVLLMELAKHRPDLRLTGLDLSEDMVALARKNLPGRTVEAGDVQAMPFGDASFDVVVASYSAHHWEDPAAAVPEIGRVLRPGGRLVLYDFDRAPYDALDTAASDWTVAHDRFRLGIPFFPRTYRHTLTPPA
jgi:ubiquinone/menaquinone biosynthesis C-methylase UbiE